MGSGGIGFGASFIKFVLFIFNFIFFVAGCGLMGVGIWIKVDPAAGEYAKIISPTDENSDPLLKNAAIAMAVVGAFILLVAFLGCCGAYTENTCLLLTYATIVGILAIIQIIAGLLAAVFSTRVENGLGEALDDGMDKYQTNVGIKRAWDSMQVWLACCGRYQFTDWETTNRSDVNRPDWEGVSPWLQYYPPSCCKMKVRDANQINDANMENTVGCYAGAMDAINSQGCEEALVKWFRGSAGIIMGIAFGLVALQFIVAAMACCLQKALNKEKVGLA